MTTRAQAQRDQVCMTPGPCDDCGEPFRSYMATDEVWTSAGLPPYGALVCIPCLASRLGGDLTAADLLDCAANDWIADAGPVAEA